MDLLDPGWGVPVWGGRGLRRGLIVARFLRLRSEINPECEVGCHSAAKDSDGIGRPSSPRAWRTILRPPDRPRAPMIAATITSGHPVPVPNTPAAASITARFPMASLREQIQTERMFASPVRKR